LNSEVRMRKWEKGQKTEEGGQKTEGRGLNSAWDELSRIEVGPAVVR